QEHRAAAERRRQKQIEALAGAERSRRAGNDAGLEGFVTVDRSAHRELVRAFFRQRDREVHGGLAVAPERTEQQTKQRTPHRDRSNAPSEVAGNGAGRVRTTATATPAPTAAALNASTVQNHAFLYTGAFGSACVTVTVGCATGAFTRIGAELDIGCDAGAL